MSIVVCGLDIASCSGVAWVRPGADGSTWRAIALQAEGEDAWTKVGDFAGALRELLAADRPDFAVIERPLGIVVEYERKRRAPLIGGPERGATINAATTITLSGLAGAAIATLEGLGIGWATIPSATWRGAYFGKGYRPQESWKKSAVDMARLQKVPLPPTMKAAADAAEAVGVACAWARSTPAPRHRKAWLALRMGRFAGREVA